MYTRLRQQQITDLLDQEINKLAVKVDTKISEISENDARYSIYHVIKNTLAIYKFEVSQRTLVNLYLTAKKMLEALDEADFKTALQTYFKTREEDLRGDCLDYGFSKCLANSLCRKVAKIAFPEKSPYETLLSTALNDGREKPWENLYTFKNKPPRFGKYFRTEDNRIELYNVIIDQAVAQITSGVTNLNEIFCTTDFKNGQRPLTSQEISILKKRSYIIANFINRLLDVELHKHENDIIANFRNLATGLRAGGSAGSYANANSYQALSNFYTWWDQLQPGIQDKIREVLKKQSYSVDTLFIVRDYCTVILSGQVEYATSILIDHIKSIADTEYLSGQEIQYYKKKISAELQHPPQYVINTGKNKYQALFDNIPNILIDERLAAAQTDDDWKNIHKLLTLQGAQDAEANLLKIIQSITDAEKLVHVFNIFMELEKQNPQLIRALPEGERMYRWENTSVSKHWSSMIHLVKQRVLELTANTIINNDEVKHFMAERRTAWANFFKITPESNKQFVAQQKTLKLRA